MTDRLAGWLVTVVVTAVAFVLRVVHLGRPNALIFDETYYAKDAYSLLRFGYERAWPSDANDKIIAGNPDVMNQAAAFVVHPPVGKWLIAVGEQLFGMTSVGWRVAPLIAGTLLVLVLIRLVRRVSRSTLIGGIAGLLLAFDGLAYVMSRVALLDIFLAFFVVAGVACLAADRDWFRNRLADHLERHGLADLGDRFGPGLAVRPWRIAAGVCFGLAIGSKWSALYVLAAFALLSLAWDVGARRLAGAGSRSYVGIIRDGVPAFVSLVVLAGFVYLSTWASWLTTSGGYDRAWAAQHPEATTTRLLGAPLASLIQFHRDIWDFHTGDFINTQTHSYDAKPIGWLLLVRPLSMHYQGDIPAASQGCSGPDTCVSAVLAIGTPALWWAGVIALIAAAILWVGARDWRFSIPVVGVLAAWLPWFAYDTRPVFYFYAIAVVPFTVMAVALCLGRLISDARAGDRRMIGGVLAGAFITLVAANFAWFYPILSGEPITHAQWLARMWFRSWI
ncbi:MAG: phospholipid carrier-dependent glycosyltransferase [Microlunatus sp.]|nr:phospholipid carrier-dependent glycosyltransferase [Microlunatus sp.]